MRYLARIVLLVPVLWIFVPSAAPADKNADKKAAEEEYANINPPAPYRLFVAASPSKWGAEQIEKIFSPKTAKKIWRPTYDQWFTLVPAREGAEITIDATEAAFDQKPGFKTVYYINGRLTITDIVKDGAIRGDDTGNDAALDMLRRILHFMRDHHKEAVLAHTGASAAAAPPAAESGEEEDHPLYAYWAAFKPGSWVARKSEGTLTSETRETLKSVAPNEVVIEVAVSGRPPRAETIPARRKVEAKGAPWQESDEVIDVAGKPLRCHAQKTAEMSRWYCREVPGGFAKFEWRKDGKYVQKMWATTWERKP